MSILSFIAATSIGCCVVLAAPFGASSQPAPAVAPVGLPAAAAPPVVSADQSYVLGPADVIEVEVVGPGDFKAQVKIAPDGTVQLPYIGSFVAANMTTQQLADALAKVLEAGGYFSHPIMRVDIVGYASRYVTVLGDVGLPGLIPIDRPYHLSEILARVGGVREGAADYVIIRSDKGGERRMSVTALATGDITQDPMVLPGDKIFSPAAELFYISGQIKLPGGYPLVSGMTLRMAISRGGGLTDLGTDRAVRVTRGGKKLSRADLDGPVQAGDVIVVGERLF